MATSTIKDIDIKKYRLTDDGNIVIDYVDNTSDVLPYSRDLELAILKKYKSQVISQKNDYYNTKRDVRKRKQFILTMAGIALASTLLLYGTVSMIIPIGLAVAAGVSGVKLAADMKKVKKLRRKIALADNIEKINKHNIETQPESEKALGKEPELFNLSKHDEYSDAEARRIIVEAKGNDYELRSLKTKVYQKVKSKLGNC